MLFNSNRRARNRKLCPLSNDVSPDPAPLSPWEEVQVTTQAYWPRIAGDLDLPVDGVKFQRLGVNLFADHQRCVLLVSLPDQRRYVLRAEYSGSRAAREQRVLERMRRDATALEAVPGVMVPEILWQHESEAMVLMELCPGTTMHQELTYCEFGLGNRAKVVERVGAALYQLHKASGFEPQQFWPKVYLEQIRAKAEEVRSGACLIRRQPKFLGLCAYLHRAARRARGQPYQGALEHGDLHMYNVLISEEQISFIDFNNTHARMPYHDIARLWLQNCPDHLAPRGTAEGLGAVAAEDWEAFSRGYGVDLQQDPVFQFCFALRVWRQWQSLPAPGDSFPLIEQGKEKGLMRAFNWLIEHEVDEGS